MTIYTRPDELVFADSAKTGEVVAFPDIPRGWGLTAEQTDLEPPMEWMNGLFLRQDKSIRYFMQRGVAEWSTTEDYPLNALVQFRGQFYQALQENKGRTPDISENYWLSFDAKYGERPGELILSFNIFTPNRTLPCYGGTVLIVDYPSLFAVIGTKFGGDGVTTFGLPNYPDGYALLAAGSTSSVGQSTIGQSASHSHNLVINNAGNHQHSIGYHSVGYTGTSNSMYILNGDAYQKATSWAGDHTHSGYTTASGGAFNAAAGVKTMIYITY